MNNGWQAPKGGLYEIICKIRDDDAAEKRSLSSVLSELKADLPASCSGIPRGQAKAVIESYHLQKQAEEIASYLRPPKF